MKNADTIFIEILDDGKIKVTTDRVSQPNHQSAENLLKELFSRMGGKRVIKQKKSSHTHQHGHGHHTHDEQKQ